MLELLYNILGNCKTSLGVRNLAPLTKWFLKIISTDWVLWHCTTTYQIMPTSNWVLSLIPHPSSANILILKYISDSLFSLHANYCCLSSSPGVSASLFMDSLPQVQSIFHVLLCCHQRVLSKWIGDNLPPLL